MPFYQGKPRRVLNGVNFTSLHILYFSAPQASYTTGKSTRPMNPILRIAFAFTVSSDNWGTIAWFLRPGRLFAGIHVGVA
jgi:hypothetical protein